MIERDLGLIRAVQIRDRKMERRLRKALAMLLPDGDASPDEIDVYARVDAKGFPYKGFIVTPIGVLHFDTGWAVGITKREFKRLSKFLRFPKIAFPTLIEAWHRHGLRDGRIVERHLVAEWLPRLAEHHGDEALETAA